MPLLDSFPHKCTIRRRVRTKGTLGGSKDSFTNEQTNVACWEQPATPSEILKYEKRGMEVNRKVYFLVDPSIDSRRQILITERQGTAVSSPTPLDVRTESLPDASAGLGVVYKVMCDEVTTEDD